MKYAPAVLINQKEEFLLGNKYDKEEYAAYVIDHVIRELAEDLLSVNIVSEIIIKDYLTTLTPSRKTEIMLDGKRLMLKKAEFYIRTFGNEK